MRGSTIVGIRYTILWFLIGFVISPLGDAASRVAWELGAWSLAGATSVCLFGEAVLKLIVLFHWLSENKDFPKAQARIVKK